MAAAVKQVNAHAETMGSQAALFMNINAAKGLWHSRGRNQELIRRLQCAYASLCATRGHSTVSLRHVRAHSRIAGNEVADRLAKMAGDGDLDGDGSDVLRHARDEHLSQTAHAGAPQTAPGLATSTSSSTPSAPPPAASHYVPPVVPHSLADG